MAFGGLYPCVDMVDALLSTPDNGQPRRILDVGTT